MDKMLRWFRKKRIAFSAHVQLITTVMIEELLGENPKQGISPLQYIQSAVHCILVMVFKGNTIMRRIWVKVQSVHYIPCQYGGDFFCTLITEYRKSLFIPLVFGNPVRYRYGFIPTVIRTNTAKPLERSFPRRAASRLEL